MLFSGNDSFISPGQGRLDDDDDTFDNAFESDNDDPNGERTMIGEPASPQTNTTSNPKKKTSAVNQSSQGQGRQGPKVKFPQNQPQNFAQNQNRFKSQNPDDGEEGFGNEYSSGFGSPPFPHAGGPPVLKKTNQPSFKQPSGPNKRASSVNQPGPELRKPFPANQNPSYSRAHQIGLEQKNQVNQSRIPIQRPVQPLGRNRRRVVPPLQEPLTQNFSFPLHSKKVKIVLQDLGLEERNLFYPTEDELNSYSYDPEIRDIVREQLVANVNDRIQEVEEEIRRNSVRKLIKKQKNLQQEDEFEDSGKGKRGQRIFKIRRKKIELKFLGMSRENILKEEEKQTLIDLRENLRSQEENLKEMSRKQKEGLKKKKKQNEFQVEGSVDSNEAEDLENQEETDEQIRFQEAWETYQQTWNQYQQIVENHYLIVMKRKEEISQKKRELKSLLAKQPQSKKEIQIQSVLRKIDEEEENFRISREKKRVNAKQRKDFRKFASKQNKRVQRNEENLAKMADFRAQRMNPTMNFGNNQGFAPLTAPDVPLNRQRAIPDPLDLSELEEESELTFRRIRNK